jgi:flagellar biosynthetic protein FliR
MNQLELLFHELGFRTSVSLTIFGVALIACRVLPLTIMSPFLGGEQLEPQVRLGVGLLLSFVLFPAVQPRLSELPVTALPFVLLICKEIFIGTCLAYIVTFVFEAAQVAGHLVDVMSGAQMAQVMAPLIQVQATIYATFKMMLATVLFLTLDGHHVVIQTLGDSIIALPVDKLPGFSQGMFAFFELLLRDFGDMIRIGVILSGPGIIAAFITDLGMGMINRVAPQVQVFFVAMAIKPLVAAALTFLVIFIILDRVRLEFGHMLGTLKEAVKLLL